MSGKLDLPVLDDVIRRVVKVAEPERVIMFKRVEEPEYLEAVESTKAVVRWAEGQL